VEWTVGQRETDAQLAGERAVCVAGVPGQALAVVKWCFTVCQSTQQGNLRGGDDSGEDEEASNLGLVSPISILSTM
jgi:hypothetical protein